MKKSVLVIDTPSSCKECPFCRGLNACKVMKCLNGDKITTIYTVDKQVMEGGRPDWCPLQDAPEKKDKNTYHNERESGYVDGWNECIEKMLGSGVFNEKFNSFIDYGIAVIGWQPLPEPYRRAKVREKMMLEDAENAGYHDSSIAPKKNDGYPMDMLEWLKSEVQSNTQER